MNKYLILLILLSCYGALPLRAQGQGVTTETYPTKPVRVVVGLAPGGGTDIQARLLAQKLSEFMGRSFVVDFVGRPEAFILAYCAAQGGNSG